MMIFPPVVSADHVVLLLVYITLEVFRQEFIVQIMVQHEASVKLLM